MRQYCEDSDRRGLCDRTLAIPEYRSTSGVLARRAWLHWGLLGVTVLSSVDGTTIKPYLALLLTLVGVRVLIRFIRPHMTAQSGEQSAERVLSER